MTDSNKATCREKMVRSLLEHVRKDNRAKERGLRECGGRKKDCLRILFGIRSGDFVTDAKTVRAEGGSLRPP